MSDQLAVARLLVAGQRPYYGSVLWALQPTPVTDFAKKAPGPIGVDAHLRLYYDPIVIATYTPDYLAAVIVHEIGHVLRAHSRRQGSREAIGITDTGTHVSIWNLAGDCVAPGTQITMANGTTAPIETIQRGDLIVGVRRGRPVLGWVTAILARPRDGMGIELSANGATLRSTLDHRVLTEGGYVRTEEFTGQTAQVYRVRTGAYLRALPNPYDSGNRDILRTPLSECAEFHAGQRHLRVTPFHQAAKLDDPTDAYRPTACVRCGARGWRRDAIRWQTLQPEAGCDVLPAVVGHQQHQHRAEGTAGIVGLHSASLHEYEWDTVLEAWLIGSRDRRGVPVITSVVGREGTAERPRRTILCAACATAFESAPHVGDVSDLARDPSFEHAISSTRRVALDKGTVYYDLVTTCHSFIADGFVVHNCEINDDLKAEGLDLGPHAIYPASYTFPDSLLAEEYYELLLRDMPKHKPRAGVNCGSVAGGGRQEHEEEIEGSETVAPGVGQVEQELIRQKVAEDVEAYEKKRGTVPAWLSRWAKERRKSRVNWHKHLAALVRRAIGDVRGQVDYSYTRPGRRSGSQPDFVWPAMRQPTPRVAIVVDTSGSMSGPELEQALAEVEGVLTASGQRTGITVLSVDAAVHTTQKIFKAQDVKLVGGGGTDMTVGLRAAEAMMPRPHVVILVTDCETNWPDRPLRMPLIVARTSNTSPAPTWATVVDVIPETKE